MKKVHILIVAAFSFLSILAEPVKAMLGADGSSMVQTDGHDLPDGIVEVEFLESTGTQWIDTGILPLNGFQLECLFQVISFNDGSIGVLSREGTRRAYLNFYYNKIYPRFGNGFPGGKFSIGENKVAVVFNRQDLFVDGIAGEYVFNDIDDSFQTDSFYLFAANRDGAVSGSCLLRIFSVTLSNYGEVEFDAIPVRFLNENNEWEGAMYDFVSGELFRNQGSGYFIIGPDLEE